MHAAVHSSAPVRLLIHGASGRMGSALIRLAGVDDRFVVAAAYSRSSGLQVDGAVVSAELSDAPEFDVALDFSLPEGFDQLLTLCAERGAALVTGTTGLSAGQFERFDQASRVAPLLWAANFSLGVIVLEDLVRRAAAALSQWNVELTETHHVHKKDAPSGTALILAGAAKAAGGTLPPIESVREGEVVGNHRIRFSGPGEFLELIHDATSRDIFARGALEAAWRLAGKPPGRYQPAELLFES